ncbi:hypothetical protein MKX01_001765 [Papaver californicum]|nr:hypothetical protein MKX01_001765 [Papaver californicum]
MSSSNKIAFHARSTSFPTRSNPLTAAVEAQLCKLRSSDLTSSISNNLVALKDLYECVEDFLFTEDGKCLDAVLDRSVMLLDVCAIIKDVLSMMKQSARDLQSSIRRRSNEFAAYVISRKKVCKIIQNCLSDLKKNTNKNNDVDADILTEVEATALAVFESVLSFLSAPKQRSLILKLTTKSATQQVVNEVTTVDVTLKSKFIEAKEMQKPLAALEMSLQDLEDGLESVFRCLIKNRLEAQLCKLRSFDLTSSISNNLVALKDLYECVEDFLSTEDIKCLDAVLDKSVLLLDVCATIKDVLSIMKQSAQDLQSSIRRRSNEFDAYMISRKKICKVIQKCLADLKKNTNKNNDLVPDILTEVEATTLAVFESILTFLSAPKQSNWSLVSKLTTKSATQQVVNEVTTVDVALKSKFIEAKEMQKPLAALEMSLQDLEDGLESVFSLPTTSYPLTLVVEEQLCQLRSSEQPTSSSSISNKLAGLTDLYESVDDFLSTHDAKCLDTVLDGSIMLLDVCSTIKDVLSQMKQSAQDLQSSIRRRSNEVDTYMTSRKKVAKVIRKCLTDLKRTANKKHDLVADVSLLKEVEATTLAVFESILSFVSEPKQNKSLISKLMSTKGEAQQISEVMKIDIALKSKEIEVKDVQKPLKAVEMNLQDLENGLESVFRCLIKNRVSLLNILNQ